MELHRSVLRPAALTAALLAVALAPLARADPVAPEALPDATERVIALGRVWAKAKFYHPYLAYKAIDWDAALVASIPKAEAATTVAEYRAAVQGMLAALGDPATRVIEPRTADRPKPAATEWLSTPSPGVVEIKVAAFMAGPADFAALQGKAAKATAEIATAKVVVLDVRGNPASSFVMDQVVQALPAIDDWPLERSLEHHGFRTQEGPTSGHYYSSFVTTGARPPKPAPKAGPSHAVFMVDADGGVPDAAIALQAAGRGIIVAQGTLDEASAVTTTLVELPGKLSAELRVGELLWGSPVPDVTIAKNQDAEARALAIARSVASAPPRARPRKIVPLPELRARDDLDYPDAAYPPRERRLLAGIRLWAVLDNFLPYRYLIADWDGALRAALPRLADAADRDAYRRALRELAVAAGDGHINIRPATPDAGAKRGLPPFMTRLVEGKLVVVRLLDDVEAKKLGIAVGDVVETIDGKPAAAKLADVRGETSGSTDEARDQRVAMSALAGDDGNAIPIGVRGADGKLREVAVARSEASLLAMRAKSTAPHWKKLAGNIGYADLSELVVPEVAPMFADLKDTRAIVFDMRGYPNGTAWSIAPRVNTRKARHGAEFLQPLRAGSLDVNADWRVRFQQPLPMLPAGATVYTGKIVVLIDDRAISQAEHTCLFLESAAGAKFIGSPTHGANGDITTMRLPGGLRMWFTGQEVRHVDGRQLQKVGIQPDILVRPTIAGVRAGKDEVLERALTYLTSNR